MSGSPVKLWVTIAFVLFAVLPAASSRFDAWMNDTQDQMVTNQAMAEQKERDIARADNQERIHAAHAQNCEGVLDTQRCSDPTSFRDLEGCLRALRGGSCDDLQGVNLCAAVGEIRECRAPRSDAVAAGCKRLRIAADCAHRPAPESGGESHDWSISPR